ncbi:MAG: outer membrane beta-barrel protein [Hyphomicrobiales bacterium]|nr:outer membrane beta-barrel protein [Hyphomicrobiales bacterium]
MVRGVLLGALASCAVATLARAADLPSQDHAPVLKGPAPVVDNLGFFMRLGVTYGLNTSQSTLYAQPGPGLPLLELLGVGAKIADVFTLGAQFGYFLTNNVSAEIAVGLPLDAKVTTTGNGGGGLPPVGTRLATVMPAIVPLTVDYHFTQLGAFQPYLGIGIAPLFSFRQSDGLDTGVTVDPTVGLVLQAGTDVMIDRHWGVTFDVKKVFAYGKSHATGIAGVPVPLASEQHTHYQPWLLTTGVVYRF